MRILLLWFLPLFLAAGCSQKSALVIDNSGSYYSKKGISKYAVIEYGDTLDSIAKKYAVSSSDILELNGMQSAGDITPGRTVAIPSVYKDNFSENLSRSKDVGYAPSVNSESGVDDGGYFYTREKIVREKQFTPDESSYDISISENAITGSSSSSQDSPPITSQNEGRRAVHFATSASFRISSPLGLSNFEWPLYGTVIERYGKHSNKFNDGINIVASVGDSVRGAADGKVIYVGKDVEGYGNLVILKHEGSYMTAYAHLQDVSVEKGAAVKRGEIIGSVGQSGSISEPQLHFSIRKGKATIDPESVE